MSNQIDPNVLAAHLEEAKASASFYQQRCVELNLTIRQVTKKLQEAQEKLSNLAAEITAQGDKDLEYPDEGPDERPVILEKRPQEPEVLTGRTGQDPQKF